jgi:aminocarboxymuconate-semialdehyde decarboxylase
VFDAPTLNHLIERFGASQLMIGTDYPFAFHDARPVDSIAAAVPDRSGARANRHPQRGALPWA